MKRFLITLFLLLWAVPVMAADVNYSGLGTLGAAPATNDLVPMWDTGAGATKTMTVAEMFTDPTFTGEIGIGAVNVSETELGILEGATLTTTEINYVDDVTSAIQTQLNARALESVVGTSIGNGLRLDGAVLKADRDFSSQAYTASGNISAAHILANKFLTNYGEDAAENDLVLPDIEYYAGVIFIIEAAYNIEINPPNADAHEALDLDGTTLDASDCVDSDSTIGSKIVATRVHLAGGWKWSLDTIRGVWTDTGASD